MNTCTTTPALASHQDYMQTKEYKILAAKMLKAGISIMDTKVILRAAFSAGWYRSEERFDVQGAEKLN